MKKILNLTLFMFILLSLGACAGIQQRDNKIPGYKITVVQGNELTMEQFAGLHTGMTKDEVIRVLGRPQLANPFRDDTWYYDYGVVKADKFLTKSKLTLRFTGDKLSNIASEDFTPVDPSQNQTKKPRKRLWSR